MGFFGALAKIGGTLGGHALGMAVPGIGPIAGSIGGSILGGAASDIIEGDKDWSSLTGTVESPTTWMPLAMPELTTGGKLQPSVATTIGGAYGKSAEQQKQKAAALETAERAQQAKAHQYLMMTQMGLSGGGGGGMSLQMMMMMQGAGKK